MSRSPLDDLPPEARFVIRALAAGSGPDRLAELLGTDAATLHKHLRTVARATGATPPPPAAGDDALRAALGPALELAAEPPARRPATPCLEPDVIASIGTPTVHGPLLLAALEHAADCPDCLAAVREKAGSGMAPPQPTAPRGRGDIYTGIAVGIALALAYLFFR